MAYAFAAVAEPSRRQILDALRAGTRSVGELVDITGLSQPGVSKHLRALREHGLVSVRRDAQRRLYDIDPAPLADLDQWLPAYPALWEDPLAPFSCPPTHG